ncbi:hypothetical protein [Microbacterium paraoxydans]|uniref:Uncharacterized protein n=1 Tax=Microbacterium paraoxydans TaxID=199592 RepID=A0A1H1PWH8_9MICO|nr:hypothetical protein [Microbacterium paraoxydans]SDS15456.1 hypothetical protein SAMN04489809_1209 [Microbacterium paraoxydans]
MNETINPARELYERAERDFDIEAWAQLTPEQTERHRKFGARRQTHRDDPLPQVPYEERTVRQVIYTFSRINPAWAAEVQQHRSPYALARTLAFVAHERGFGLGDVLGRVEADRLESALLDFVAFSFDEDPPALHNLTREQRAVWFEWFQRTMALPVEDRWRELPPTFGGAQ